MSWLGGALGLAGSLFSGFSNQNSADKSLQWQQDFAKNKYQYMVQDLKAAGLNPMLATGASPGSTGGAQSTMENPGEAAVKGYQAANSAKVAQQQQANQNALTNAQVEQAKAQTAKTLEEANLIKAQTNESTFRVNEFMPVQMGQFTATAEQARAQASYLGEQAKLVIQQIQESGKRMQEYDARISQLQQLVKESKSNVTVNNARKELMRYQQLSESENAKLTKARSEGAMLENKFKDLGLGKAQSEAFYHGNYIGRTFDYLGNMIKSVSPVSLNFK